MPIEFKMFKDLEFQCPNCGKTIKVWQTICKQNLRMDTEITETELDTDGRLRVSYPYLECDCGEHMIIDIEPQLVSIYDSNNRCVTKLDYYYI